MAAYWKLLFNPVDVLKKLFALTILWGGFRCNIFSYNLILHIFFFLEINITLSDFFLKDIELLCRYKLHIFKKEKINMKSVQN